MLQKIKNRTKKIHLWIALSCGIVIFIVAITGSIYAFQNEIQNLTQPYRFVQAQDKPFLLPSQIETIAEKQLPNKLLHSVKYNTPDKACEAIFYNYNPSYYYIIYLNPYNGKVLKVADMETGFFKFILEGHFNLWLPRKIGALVVSIATLLFFVMIITGLILWLPKNIKQLKQRTWFNWKFDTRWRRKNYDLHNILGFFSSTIAIIFIITGLVWGFQWFAVFYYNNVLGGTKSLKYTAPISNKISTTNSTLNPIDILYLQIKQSVSNAKSIEVHPPETDTSAIAINTNTEEGTFWKADYKYFNQYSLQEIEVNNIWGKLQNANTADKLMRMNYDIHTGGIFGFAGKLFAFLISLLIASLPITGFYIWWGRKRK